MAVLSAHDYPGNVRELRNLVERLAILCEGPEVSRRRGTRAAAPCETRARSPARRRSRPPSSRPPQRCAPWARSPSAIWWTTPSGRSSSGALAFTRDNATEAARLLDLERGHFYKKMKALGIRRPRAQTSDEGDGRFPSGEGSGPAEAT